VKIYAKKSIRKYATISPLTLLPSSHHQSRVSYCINRQTERRIEKADGPTNIQTNGHSDKLYCRQKMINIKPLDRQTFIYSDKVEITKEKQIQRLRKRQRKGQKQRQRRSEFFSPSTS
jgi:hypothetical protein